MCNLHDKNSLKHLFGQYTVVEFAKQTQSIVSDEKRKRAGTEPSSAVI